jgi:hypothetical protein
MREEILELSQELERGDKEAVKQKFWKIVGKLKRNEIELNDEDIGELSRIRDRLFEREIVLSARKGSILFPLGFLASIAVFILVNSLSGFYLYPLLFISELPVIYFGFLTGRLMGSTISGIGIDGFYRYSPLEFGVKMRYIDYLKATQKERIMLYATTLCFQGVVMLILVVVVYLHHGWAVLIPLSFFLFWLIGSVIIHHTLKTGEFHRFLREIRIAMEGRRGEESG